MTDYEILHMLTHHPSMEANFDGQRPTFARIRDILRNRSCAIRICYLKGDPVGYAAWKAESPTLVSLSGGFLPQARGRLAKDFLLRELHILAAKGSFRYVVGEVKKTNKACLYMAHQLGFVKSPSRKADCWHMELDIGPGIR